MASKRQPDFWSRIPGLRRWIGRRRVRRSRQSLEDAYRLFRQSASCAGVQDIQFDAAGCVYRLVDGRRFRFDPFRAASWLYSVPFSGTFEQKETAYLASSVRPGWFCIDVGACFGWYTLLLAQKAGAQGQVHAFEPVTSNFECLRDNVALNGAANVVLNQIALGDKPGRLDLYLPPEGVSASLRPHATSARCSVLQADVSTLDAYVHKAGLQRLDFVKVDIEGAELLLLRGAEQALVRFRPMLMLEIQKHSTRLFGYEPKAVFAWLAVLGYKAYYVDQQGTLVGISGTEASRLPDYNFIFLAGNRT